MPTSEFSAKNPRYSAVPPPPSMGRPSFTMKANRSFSPRYRPAGAIWSPTLMLMHMPFWSTSSAVAARARGSSQAGRAGGTFHPSAWSPMSFSMTAASQMRPYLGVVKLRALTCLVARSTSHRTLVVFSQPMRSWLMASAAILAGRRVR